MMGKNLIECNFDYEIIDGEVTITRYNDDSAESIIIPESIGGLPVTKIDLYCFWYQNNLISLYIPKSINIYHILRFKVHIH